MGVPHSLVQNVLFSEIGRLERFGNLWNPVSVQVNLKVFVSYLCSLLLYRYLLLTFIKKRLNYFLCLWTSILRLYSEYMLYVYMCECVDTCVLCVCLCVVIYVISRWRRLVFVSREFLFFLLSMDVSVFSI